MPLFFFDLSICPPVCTHGNIKFLICKFVVDLSIKTSIKKGVFLSSHQADPNRQHGGSHLSWRTWRAGQVCVSWKMEIT
jgi:hypothetical protein